METDRGFRPEHFRLARGSKDSANGDFQVRVENVEYLGAEFILSGCWWVAGPDGQKVIARPAAGT